MEKMRSTSVQGIGFIKYVLILSLLLLLAAAQMDAQYGSTNNEVSLGFGPQVGLYKAQDADNMKVMGMARSGGIAIHPCQSSDSRGGERADGSETFLPILWLK
jgi:hypothetical protein